MNNRFNERLIQQRAEKLVKEIGISTFPVNPIAIAENAEIVVAPKNDQADGVSGMLIRVGETVGIMFSTYYHNQGFENFSISHELGHYYLDGHIDYLLASENTHCSHAGFVSYDPYEREADLFAAGLLMPEDMFKDQLWKYEKGLDGIIAMAELCHTSITATAIRYAELTDSPLMIVISQDNHIEYCVLSDKLWRLRDKEIPKHGMPVPRHTSTEVMGKNQEKILACAKSSSMTDLSDWIEGSRSRDALEEVMGLGKYRKVLTAITLS